MAKITNLKLKVSPLTNVKKINDDLTAGKDVTAATDSLGNVKLRLEFDADVATVQKVVKFIQGLGKAQEEHENNKK